MLFYPLQPSHTQLLSENGNEARQHMTELIKIPESSDILDDTSKMENDW